MKIEYSPNQTIFPLFLTFSLPKHRLNKNVFSISMFFFSVFSKVPHRLRSFTQKSSKLHPKLFNQPSQTTRHRSHQNRPHKTLSPTGTVRLRHPQTLQQPRLELPIAATLSPSPKRRRNRLSGIHQASSQSYLHARCGCQFENPSREPNVWGSKTESSV